MYDILSLSKQEIYEYFLNSGYPEEEVKSYYLDYIFDWIHKKFVWDFSKYTNLPKKLRSFLKKNCFLYDFLTYDYSKSSDGTTKYRFFLDNNKAVETVYIPKKSYRTVCLSSQIGCKWGCEFCYTGKMGQGENLTASQIIAQLYNVIKIKGKITHIVFMGMGEPLDNYNEVIRAIRIFNHPNGQHIGIRRITISTVGILPGIEKLLTENLTVNLALSLHSPISEIREKLVPAEKVYPLKRLIPLLKQYYLKTKRQISLEYIVIRGTNDDDYSARKLYEICQDWDCKINLITHHLINMDTEQYKINRQCTINFANKLKGLGLKKVTIRASRGWDIKGACGELIIQNKTVLP